jgi:hypothetical protein
MPTPYTKELLKEILLEGDATVLEVVEKLSQRRVIRFRCACGVETSKRFEMLRVHRLPYCEACSKIHMVEKQKKTCLERFGVENASMAAASKEKTLKTYQEKYGDHPKRTLEVHQKWVNTCLEKYGGHPNQNREVQVKSEFKGCHYKDFVFPSGKVVKVQGYEHLALRKLLESVKEEDIVVGKSNVPTIDYWITEKKHVYFPDIFVPSENLLIEVKSEWSLQFPSNVEEKAHASVAAGYVYEIWIFNGKQQFASRILYGFDGSKQTLPA